MQVNSNYVKDKINRLARSEQAPLYLTLTMITILSLTYLSRKQIKAWVSRLVQPIIGQNSSQRIPRTLSVTPPSPRPLEIIEAPTVSSQAEQSLIEDGALTDESQNSSQQIPQTPSVTLPSPRPLEITEAQTVSSQAEQSLIEDGALAEEAQNSSHQIPQTLSVTPSSPRPIVIVELPIVSSQAEQPLIEDRTSPSASDQSMAQTQTSSQHPAEVLAQDGECHFLRLPNETLWNIFNMVHSGREIKALMITCKRVHYVLTKFDYFQFQRLANISYVRIHIEGDNPTPVLAARYEPGSSQIVKDLIESISRKLNMDSASITLYDNDQNLDSDTLISQALNNGTVCELTAQIRAQ